MRTIPRERVLRVNCSGFGQDKFWDPGSAKPLNEYSVILVNPVSISHLFDKDPEMTRNVEQAMLEGASSYTVDSDEVLQLMANDVDSRIHELSDFLTQGGFLLYFLCRPFIVQGPNIALDNYYWLESLAPDQPTEKNVRHMSAVSHGRLVEPTQDGEDSEFSAYLKQPALEWNTLIRTEYLTEGYHMLATAGEKKCIAGQLYIVGSSGRVVFLPSPYSPDFELTLMDCINEWYATKDPSEAELEAEKAQQALEAIPVEVIPQPMGKDMFAREPEPIASVSAITAPAPSPVQAPAYYKFTSESSVPSAPAAESAPPANAFDERIQDNAKRFEQDVAERVSAQQKKTSGGIDLSMFAQTAQKIVKSSTDAPPIPQTPVPPPKPAQFEVDSEPELEPELEPEPEPVFAPAPVAPPPVAQEVEPEPPPITITEDIAEVAEIAELPLDTFSNELISEPEPPTISDGVQEVTTQDTNQSDNSNDRSPRREPQKPVLNTLFKKEPTDSAPPPASSRRSSSRKPAPIVTSFSVPDWCKAFSFSFLDQLHQENSSLNDELEQLQARIEALNNRIEEVEKLKRALLAGQGEVLKEACSQVLSQLNWTIGPAGVHDSELLLSVNNQPESIARVVASDGECNRSDAAQLAESAISFWDEHEIEPKGILIACTWSGVAPENRQEPDFSDALDRFAKKKGLCLMTTIQLLGIYRDLEQGNVTADAVRRQMLETNGHLEGFAVQQLVAV
ncbi:MAG: hypothetical protein K2Z81_06980 [Cyanobacteria bacterium]|nr:hypothetical protein [Cyanobacteriota bacterium]